MDSGKPVRFSGHALEQLQRRGGTRDEVVEAIRTVRWGPAELGRLECKKDFSFAATWNGKQYATKQVRPVFVDSAREIVVVTVYVYFY